MSQGQYQPPRKTASSNSARHIYSESGDVNASRQAKSAGKSKKAPKPHGKLGRFLEKIPYAAGIALCVAMLIVSLFAGNARALSAAKSEAMEAWTVSEYVSGRVGEARNLLTLCERNDISPELTQALKDASDALSKAANGGVSEVVTLNQQLETAASNASAALLSGKLSASDERALSSTMDDFREQGNFLRQQAREYNEKAADALALYNKLPTKFLLSAPETASID